MTEFSVENRLAHPVIALTLHSGCYWKLRNVALRKDLLYNQKMFELT